MKYCIGVDLGGTNIAAGLVDFGTHEILRKLSVKTNAPRPCEEISTDIAKLARRLCKEQGISLSSVAWVGVATPGIVKNETVLTATNLGWTNEPLGVLLSRQLGRPSYIANDANAAAYAEAIWGVGQGTSSLVELTLGTGVGGGIVINGNIWDGFNGFAAEIGHMVIKAGGRECSCGKLGCLEAYCSATALVKETKRIMKLYPDSTMWSVCGGDIDRVNGKTAFVARKQGDYAARLVVDSFIDNLAVGVSNIINIFQPSVVCIGGGISGEGENLMAPLRDRVARTSFGLAQGKTKVLAGKYRNDAGIIGAALLGLQEDDMDKKSIAEILIPKFDIEGVMEDAVPYGNGHINDTYLVTMRVNGGTKQYILQRINKHVFKRPDKLMDNFYAVTEFIRDEIIKEGRDPERESIRVIKSSDGRNFYMTTDGDYWRVISFVTDSVSYDKVERPQQFYDSAVAFGKFQYMLRNFPAEELYETIKDFHNTPVRYRQLMDAAEKDNFERRAEVEKEIEFATARLDFIGTFERAHAEGKLPLKVTHNDTKLNNILFDKNSGKPICVIDLDTIMPGYSVNDFGDSIRFGATTALEDEADLSKVNFDIQLFEVYVKGFLEGARGGLTDCEISFLPHAAMMMTLECGMRFLADYLNGDTYFKTSRQKQNLDRARNQFKLVSDMEKQFDEMKKIVAKYAAKS